MKRIFFIIPLICIFYNFLYATKIDESKVDIYFGNGVWNTEDVAKINRDELQKVINKSIIKGDPKLKKKYGKVKLAYNWKKGKMEDLLETFYQLKENGQISEWLFFTLVDELIAKVTSDLTNTALEKMRQKIVGMITSDEESNTQEMIEKYNKESIKLGHRALLISHSQGNLFANRIYEQISPLGYQKYFANLQIASPANEVKAKKGDYVTGYIDPIINPIPGSMPSNANLDSPGGHKFIEAYLSSEDTYTKIIIKIQELLSKLDSEVSQWRVKEKLNKNTKEYRIKVKHKFDDTIKIDKEIYPFNIAKKIYPLPDPNFPEDKEKFVYVKASEGGTKIIDAELNPWEDIKETEFYKLEGTNPIEYIKKELLSREILNDGFDRWIIEDGLDRVFVKHNNTVIDKTLGLMWQNHYEDTSGKNWQEAVNYCENLELDGFKDWRLPSIKELQSLVNYNRNYPAVEPNIWNNLKYKIIGRVHLKYWSSTKYNPHPNDNVWIIKYSYGYTEGESSDDETYNFVRCVRGTKEGEGKYKRDDKGVVTDTTTGLQWQDYYDDGFVRQGDWDTATRYCDSLNSEGAIEWRLPTVNELYSIVDFNKSSPAVNSIFQMQGDYKYWTSTKNSPGGAMSINLGYAGLVSGSFRSEIRFIRCVKGKHTNLEEDLSIIP